MSDKSDDECYESADEGSIEGSTNEKKSNSLHISTNITETYIDSAIVSSPSSHREILIKHHIKRGDSSELSFEGTTSSACLPGSAVVSVSSEKKTDSILPVNNPDLSSVWDDQESDRSEIGCLQVANSAEFTEDEAVKEMNVSQVRDLIFDPPTKISAQLLRSDSIIGVGNTEHPRQADFSSKIPIIIASEPLKQDPTSLESEKISFNSSNLLETTWDDVAEVNNGIFISATSSDVSTKSPNSAQCDPKVTLADSDEWMTELDASKDRIKDRMPDSIVLIESHHIGDNDWMINSDDAETLSHFTESIPSDIDTQNLVDKTMQPVVTSNDGWDVDEWDCDEDLKDSKLEGSETVSTEVAAVDACPQVDKVFRVQASSQPAPLPDEWSPEYLSSAATSVVKTVGGGLASFVDHFSLANLSSTLHILDSQPTKTSTDNSSINQQPPDSIWGWNWGSFAKSISSTVENKGMNIIQGGVDVLETIGKKTFTALKESDPGLEYTKKFLLAPESHQTVKLSQLLREARQQNQDEDSLLKKTLQASSFDDTESRRGNFLYQLESQHALVHMEALELLSTRASSRLQAKICRLEADEDPSVSNLTINDSILDKIWHTLQIRDEEDVDHEFKTDEFAGTLSLLEPICPSAALLQAVDELHEKANQVNTGSAMNEIFYTAVSSLAETTTAVLAYLHKLSELLLSRPDRVRNGFLDVAQNVVKLISSARKLNEDLCSGYVAQIKQASNRVDELTSGDDNKLQAPSVSMKRLVANLFLETGSANNYFGDAAVCFIPVVQLAYIDTFFPDDNPPPPLRFSRHQ